MSKVSMWYFFIRKENTMAILLAAVASLSMMREALLQSRCGLITCFPVMKKVPLVVVASGPNICVCRGIPAVVVGSEL